ncbi:SRPBCC family protein [bacterium]|nr:SRPBCC family protein [bacterium]
MLKKIAVAFTILILALTGVAYLLPAQVPVERSIVINKAPADIFPLINSWQRFNEWSPWYSLDPKAVYERSGPDTGVGATHSWRGNSDVGVGKTTITQSTPERRVDIRLEFEGMPTSNYWLTLTPEGNSTKVVWHMDANMGNNPISRWFGLAMDGMIGADYEKGLNKLKEIAEK